MNDITKVLEVPYKKNQVVPSACPEELEMLSNFDFENEINDEIIESISSEMLSPNILQKNSTAFVASIVEEKVIKKIIQKGRKSCMECANVFVENEVTDDIFIQYKSKTTNTIPPCKDTVDLIKYVEFLLKKYELHNVTFNSMLAHITKKIDTTKYYENSTFGDSHDHKNEFISLVIKTYIDVKSTNMCKFITRISQDEQIRHKYLKLIHFQGQ